MSMETLRATMHYTEGNFYGVIESYANGYPQDLGGIMMLATSYLAIGDFMKFQLVMEYYLDDKSLITKMTPGKTKEDAFYFGCDWYRAIKNNCQLEDLLNYYKESKWIEKREYSFDEHLMFLKLEDFLDKEAYKLSQANDLFAAIEGLYHMEVLENIETHPRAITKHMKRRLLNIVASSLEGPSVELFQRGMECIRKLEEEAIEKEMKEYKDSDY